MTEEALANRMLKDPAANDAAVKIMVASFNNDHRAIEEACEPLNKEQLTRVIAFMGAWNTGVIEATIDPSAIQHALGDLRSFVNERKAGMS